MRKITPFWLFFLLFLWSCTNSNSDQKRVPILEVEGKFLYSEDIEKIIPKTANKIDSAEIAERYIRNWVTNILMYENGKRNLRNESEINTQVEEYRKSLVIHQYEQALIEERVQNQVTDEELQNFYTSYSAQLTLQDNLIKGLLLILPKNAPQIEEVRTWVRNPNEKSLEKIEKYSLKSAISFEYFMNKWIPLNEILKKAPFQIQDSRTFANQKTYTETSDSTKIYMLRITNAALQGQIEPMEMAREKIKSIMLNKRQSEFIIQFEKDIFNDAVKNGTVNFFNNKK